MLLSVWWECDKGINTMIGEAKGDIRAQMKDTQSTFGKPG